MLYSCCLYIALLCCQFIMLKIASFPLVLGRVRPKESVDILKIMKCSRNSILGLGSSGPILFSGDSFLRNKTGVGDEDDNFICETF